MASDLPSFVTFVVVVLTLRGLVAIEDLDFTIEPTDTIAVRNQPLQLSCGITGVEPMTIQWVYNNQAIHSNEIHQVLANGSLYIPNVLPKRDGGLYQCCVYNHVGRICSSPARVTLASLPRYEIAQSPGSIYRSGVLRLECSSSIEAVPSPVVTWRLGKETIVEDHRKVILPTGVLQITSVDVNDAGNYRCLTENIVNRRQSPIATVVILEAPTSDSDSQSPAFISRPKQQRVKVGETAVFECFAEGSDLAVTWSRKDGRPIRTENVNYLGGCNLLLMDVTSSDEGAYICTIQNTASGISVQAQARLTVLVPPTFDKTPSRFFGPLGSIMRFLCEASGNPSPTIHWLLQGNPVELNARLTQLVTNTLVINGVKREEEGIVQCVAENEVGSIQWAAKLDIRLPGDGQSGAAKNIRLTSISADSVYITWDPPDDQGAGILIYIVHFKPVNGDGRERQVTLLENASAALVENLKAHTNYTFYVMSWTTDGQSEESEHHYIFTNQSTPSSAPEFTVASNSPTSVTVSWRSVPHELSHSPVTRYRITISEDMLETATFFVDDPRVREYTVEGLLAGRFYQVCMAAATREGFGVNSPWITVQTRVIIDTLPVAPHFKVRNVNSSTISIHPQKPEETDINLLGFRLFYSQTGALTARNPIILPLNTTEYIINGLEPDTTYMIKLQTYTVYGNGHETTLDIVTTSQQGGGNQHIAIPSNLQVLHITSRSIWLGWELPVTSQLVVGYIVRFWPIWNQSQTTIPVDFEFGENNTMVQYEITDLDPFTMYKFDVCSRSSIVTGPYCDAVATRTLEDRPSTPPEAILAKPLDPHAVEVMWQPPMEPNGIITHYIILYDQDITKPEAGWNQQDRNGTAHHSTVDGLASDTKYYFKVRAGTHVGEGPPTDTVAAQTLIAQDQIGVRTSWKQGVLIGACSAFVFTVLVVFFVVWKKRGLSKLGHPVVATNVLVSDDQSAMGTRWAANGSPDGKVYLMQSTDGRQDRNGFTPMSPMLPQPRNLDTKGGTPLVINGNGPVQGTYHLHHHHHHHPYCRGDMVLPSRLAAYRVADQGASSLALLPGGRESLTISDTGEENSQGKSQVNSTVAGQQRCSSATTATSSTSSSRNNILPHCNSCCCCLGTCSQPAESSTESGRSSGSQETGSLLLASGGQHTAYTGVQFSSGNDPECHANTRESPTSVERNKLTSPSCSFGTPTASSSPELRQEPAALWVRRAPSPDASPVSETNLTAERGRDGDCAASSRKPDQGEDTSPHFIKKVLNECSSGSTSTTV